jgi:preprotein translocase subunit YajC
MRVTLNSAVGLIALATSGVAAAQAQPVQQTTSTTTQQTPTATQTTTTNSATTAVPGTITTPAQTQTTTTKSTTVVPTDPATGAQVGPAASATTTSTTTTDASAIKAATAEDVKKGAEVYDQKGGMVGTIESVDAKGAIVATGKVRVPIPVSSFAKNDKGLVISMTKAELDAQAPATKTTSKTTTTTTKKKGK